MSLFFTNKKAIKNFNVLFDENPASIFYRKSGHLKLFITYSDKNGVRAKKEYNKQFRTIKITEDD